jgi:hypothetical protein
MACNMHRWWIPTLGGPEPEASGLEKSAGQRNRIGLPVQLNWNSTHQSGEVIYLGAMHLDFPAQSFRTDGFWRAGWTDMVGGQVRFYPTALEPYLIEEIFGAGATLADMSTVSASTQTFVFDGFRRADVD